MPDPDPGGARTRRIKNRAGGWLNGHGLDPRALCSWTWVPPRPPDCLGDDVRPSAGAAQRRSASRLRPVRLPGRFARRALPNPDHWLARATRPRAALMIEGDGHPSPIVRPQDQLGRAASLEARTAGY